MLTFVNDTQLKTIEQIRQFLNGSEAVTFSIQMTKDRNGWIETMRLISLVLKGFVNVNVRFMGTRL
ncbi:MAG: hypothetical protein ABGX83_10960 [Nitrospira sp.]|nr:hypothetical protein [Candidatus Manganitrophaceae bacterium]